MRSSINYEKKVIIITKKKGFKIKNNNLMKKRGKMVYLFIISAAIGTFSRIYDNLPNEKFRWSLIAGQGCRT